MTTKLRVRASGTALVQHHERLAEGVNAFIGRKYQELPGKPGAWGFAPTGESVEIDAETPYAAEYRNALIAGDLVAGDDATAKWAGLEPVPEEKPAVPTSPPCCTPEKRHVLRRGDPLPEVGPDGLPHHIEQLADDDELPEDASTPPPIPLDHPSLDHETSNDLPAKGSTGDA